MNRGAGRFSYPAQLSAYWYADMLMAEVASLRGTDCVFHPVSLSFLASAKVCRISGLYHEKRGTG